MLVRKTRRINNLKIKNMKKTMRAYKDFMRIRFSRRDLYHVVSAVGLNDYNDITFDLYSKIVIQFKNKKEYSQFEDNYYGDEFEIDINEFTTTGDFKEENNNVIFYADNESSFDKVCIICKSYNCNVYQFIIENELNTIENTNDELELLIYDSKRKK